MSEIFQYSIPDWGRSVRETFNKIFQITQNFNMY